MIDYSNLEEILHQLDIANEKNIKSITFLKENDSETFLSTFEENLLHLENIFKKDNFTGEELYKIIKEHKSQEYYNTFYNIFDNILLEIINYDKTYYFKNIDILFFLVIAKDFENKGNLSIDNIKKKKDFFIEDLFYL